jgi:hypothetical protein
MNRAVQAIALTFLIVMFTVLGVLHTVSSLRDRTLTSFSFFPSAAPNTTITSFADTPVDIDSEDGFCLRQLDGDVNLCSHSEPRPSSPKAARLTETLPAGTWGIVSDEGFEIFISSDLPLVYNTHSWGAVIMIDGLFFLFIAALIYIEILYN